MKKYLMLGLIMSSLIYANDMRPQLEVYGGESGIIFNNNYTSKNLHGSFSSLEKEELYKNYSLITTNNDVLMENIKNINSDIGPIFSFGYEGYNSKGLNANGGNILFFIPNYNFGINYNYSNLNAKDKDSNYFTKLDLFYRSDYDLVIDVYGGFLKENKKDNFYGTNIFYGFLKTDFENSTLLPFITANYNLYNSKNKDNNTKNNSLKTGVGVEYKYNLIGDADEKALQLVAKTYYSKEFSNKKIYKDLGNDPFEDTIVEEVAIPLILHTVEILPNYKIKKSLNKHNFETSYGINFMYKF